MNLFYYHLKSQLGLKIYDILFMVTTISIFFVNIYILFFIDYYRFSR